MSFKIYPAPYDVIYARAIQLGNLSLSSNAEGELVVGNGGANLGLTYTSDTTLSITAPATLKIIMVAGGGAGGAALIQSALVHAGGGGGGGEARVHSEIPLLEGDTLEVVVGKGGTESSPDGTDSVVTIRGADSVVREVIRVAGGKGASFNIGGNGGNGNSHPSLAGQPGQDGQSLSFPSNPIGGAGGFSFFSLPTNGGDVNSPQGEDGNLGGGGGGNAPGATTIAKGGDGFVTLAY